VAYEDLRAFVRRLEAEGELARVRAEVDPVLEISEIADRAVKAGAPALLFERVRGHSIPVLLNAFGSARRMKLALEVERLEEVAERIDAILDEKTPTSFLDKLKMVPKLAEIGSYFPKIVRDGPVKEVVRKGADATLREIPAIQCWPKDAGRYVTLPLVFTKEPGTGKRNAGIYRLQVFDERTLGMHWQLHKDGAADHRAEEAAGRRIEVAIALGCDPATQFAGAIPAPRAIDEMLLAGFLRKDAVPLVRCETVDLEVPATAEIALEGYVEPRERRREGPFGDHTGWYSLADDYPVFHLTALTHRRDPIYQSTIVGRPPMEDGFMGYAIERILLPLIRKQLPEVLDVHMPVEGIFHNLMLVRIRKAYPGHARKVMHAIWGLGQAMFTKCLVVFDEDVDLQNYSEVVWRAFTALDPQRDIQFTMGPLDVLDHAARELAFGSKMGVDATRKWPEEGHRRPWPDLIEMSAEVRERVTRRWAEYGIPGPRA
jgi:4-hydroxy-3-polyprenylbenzoate decarboxylase